MPRATVIQPTCSFIFHKHLLKAHCIPGTLLSIKKLTLNVTKPGGASDKEPTASDRDIR